MTFTGSIRAITWLAPHLIAIALAMTYAWHVSQSAYVTTGIQFISPLLIILLVHLGILALRGQLVDGYARAALAKTAHSATLLIGVIIATDILSPAQSHAATQTFEQILAVLFCLVVLAIVLAIAAGFIYMLYRVLSWLWRVLSGKDSGFNDLASIGLATALIAGASLEGVPGAYKFAGDDYSTATYEVAASPEAVWHAMQTATSPQFPLPDILHMMPQPVGVLIDEGTTLGANRVVLFRGREGQGKLHLRVTEQTNRMAQFQVISDRSPMARWVAFRELTYTIHDTDGGARLDVRLDYQRLLAPSWIFTPMIENAAFLAMSVLARDTKLRAEQSMSTASTTPSRTL